MAWKTFHLFEAIRRRDDFQLYTSVILLEELHEVLARPSLVKRLALIGMTAHEALVAYIDAVELVEPVDVPRVVPGDADDDHVIAAAVAAQASMIVSGDADLLSMGSYGSIEILSAAMAIEAVIV